MTEGQVIVSPYLAARFWSKVDVRRPGLCWHWKRATNESGYGIMRVDGVNVKAHRLALQLADGVSRPPEVKVRHMCDNPICCNPGHLEPGTQAQNIADMHSRQRRKYKSRFVAEDIKSMRRMRAEGITDVEISKKFGCSESYVSMLINGVRGASIKGAKE